MNNRLTVVVDADVLVAQAKDDDVHHATVLKLSQQLHLVKTQFVYPATALVEAATHIQRALSNTARAYDLVSVLTQPQIEVAKVNHRVLTHAMAYFSPRTSKQNTLFDCIVAAVADQYHADAIFSFDSFYKKKGFKLVSDLKLD